MNIEKIDLNKVDWRSSREFFESLGQTLDQLDDKDEHYDFTWVGKRKSVIEAGSPINKTFRPDVESSKNWNTTENLFIEGDNLDALKLLQESYLGKVKIIYIDPPYNTGKDFVYRDTFKSSVDQYDEDTDYKDESGNIQFKKNEKSNGRYHSDWLSMMYPRLKLARNLLSEDGVIFISIDDNEHSNLKKLCDEIFSEENFIGVMKRRAARKSANLSMSMSDVCDYVIAYSKTDEYSPLSVETISDNTRPVFNGGNKITLRTVRRNTPARCEDQIFQAGEYKTKSMTYTLHADLEIKEGLVTSDVEVEAPWRINQEILDQTNFVTRNGSFRRTLLEEEYDKVKVINDLIDNPEYYNENGTEEIKRLFDNQLVFDTPKPYELIKYLVLAASETDSKGEIVLDFFSGSATTAQAVFQLNAEDGGSRVHIQVQLPEDLDMALKTADAAAKERIRRSIDFLDSIGKPHNIAEIAKERIRRSGDKIAKKYPGIAADYGFRSLIIADTNYKDVYKPAAQQQQATLLDVVDNIKDDRSELDLLFGVLTQSALELNRPCKSRDLAGNTVFTYDYFGEISGLLACFSNSISEETIKAIAQLKPLTAVFRDSSFATSQDKVNLAEHFRIISPETKVKVI